MDEVTVFKGGESLKLRALVPAGWRAFRAAPTAYLLATLVAVVVDLDAVILGLWAMFTWWEPLGIIAVVGAPLVAMMATHGVARLVIDQARGRPVGVRTVASGAGLVPYAVTVAIVTITFLLGWALLVVPAFVVAGVWGLAPWLVVDEGLGPRAALRRSAEVSKGHRVYIATLITAGYVVGQLGSFACWVGLLVTFPIGAAIIGGGYRRLRDEASGGVAPDVPAVADGQPSRVPAWLPWLVAASALLPLAMLASMATAWGQQVDEIEARARPATASIVEVEDEVSAGAWVRVSYVAGDRIGTFEVLVRPPAVARVGDPVDVLYDPEHPDNVWAADHSIPAAEFSVWWGPVLMAIPALVLAGLLLAARRRPLPSTEPMLSDCTT